MKIEIKKSIKPVEYKEAISLPIYPDLTYKEIKKVVEKLRVALE